MKHAHWRRLFAAAFCLTSLFIFTALGFLAVDLSTQYYGDEAMSALVRLDRSLAALPTPQAWQMRLAQAADALPPWLQAAAGQALWLLPRWLRLGTGLWLLAA